MDLPTEILILIFEHVEDYFDLEALQATCKRFRSVLDDARFDGPLFRLIARNSNTSDVAAPSKADEWFDNGGKPFAVKLHPLLNDSKNILSVLTEHQHKDGLPIDEATTNPGLPKLELFWPVQDFLRYSIFKVHAVAPAQSVTVGRVLDVVVKAMHFFQEHHAALTGERIHWTGLRMKARDREYGATGNPVTVWMVPDFAVDRKVERSSPGYNDNGSVLVGNVESENQDPDKHEEEGKETDDENDEMGQVAYTTQRGGQTQRDVA
ncbi:hypothetical protein OC846_006438 [Tilletia horrida]|uniref:F-box domain-containing protein n=1 Tax=Tilletia horrida TaxID=155126 RepID=A0AAN6GIP4_9BASI|nr:hypothetical protein OC846_006438 [Tilletia horrida]KAK0544002.1 hypothetical protein OC845_005839 [Tilletia horrida]